MKVGDLVRFKAHHLDVYLGLGVLLHAALGSNHRHWALFNNERIMVRLYELKVVSESR